MSSTFMFIACPVPLAKYTGRFNYVDIAPEEAWAGPFQRWLEQVDTANTIMSTIEVEDISDHCSYWGDFVQEYTLDKKLPIAYDDQFTAYCYDLDNNPHISDNDPDEYTRAVVQCIADRFMNVAHNVFKYDNPEGAIHKGEFVTGGFVEGDAPTDTFVHTVILSFIDFFENYPIAIVANGTITGWTDREGNFVDSPI